MQTLISRVSPFVIDKDSPMVRMPPRPHHLRQPGYEKDFDFKTLFYDVFRYRDQVVIIAPPLFNLAPFFTGSQFWFDGKLQSGGPKFAALTNLIEGFFPSAPPVARKFQFANPSHKELRASLEIQPSHCDMFAGKKVMLLISKNTHLIWLRDLIEFNAKIHGVNAVLIYDNASTSYGLEDILATAAEIEGIESAAVVPWNFPWGARGGPAEIWDSDYAQYGAIEHARLRFLLDCEAVIYTDADELVVPNTGKSLFEAVAASPSGIVGYHSHLMHKINAPETPLLRFKDLLYAEREPHLLRRWTAIPSRVPLGKQLGVHVVFNAASDDVSADFHFRHFFPLTVHPEKQARQSPIPFDETLHYRDEALVAAMRKVGWL